MQRCFLILVGDGDIGLGLEQYDGSIQLTGARREVQCRLLVLVQAVHIDPRLEVFFDGIDRADLRGDVNRLRRCLVTLARHTNASKVVGQFPLNLTSGEIKRGAPFFILGREIGLSLDQLLGHGDPIVLGRIVQRRLFAVAPQVDVHAIGEGELRHHRLAAPN